MSFRSKLFRIVIPVIILTAGFVVMRLLVLSRPAPQKEVRSNPGALVEVLTVSSKDHQVQVIGTGTVQARREASITPRVSGRIKYIAPAFIAGGFFAGGDILFEIEGVDYQLAVVRARAVLAQAELELAKVESSALVARREWEGLVMNNPVTDKNKKPNPLVLYEPQIKKARADAAAAGAALKQAELDLQRTRIYAPFDCRVRSESVEAGQYVRAGSSVAVVAGTETAEVVVPLSLEDLQWLRVPRQGSEDKGSPAIVKITVGRQSFSWQGRLVRSLGEVDPKGRMARVVVAVDDPYYLNTRRNNEEPDLEMGMFVEVTFHGKVLPGVFPVPANALRENNTVWVVNKEDRLNIRPVTVVRREQERVIISDGLKEGERLVLTTISGAAEGMKLRLIDKAAGR
ncbi:MAG: efflux RND transporter periplasmic adaptor subunit [Nitrospirota bacterium]|nr:efflux RND transporter periplasmic adaptor subunit [Nitrospirota bacterium]